MLSKFIENMEERDSKWSGLNTNITKFLTVVPWHHGLNVANGAGDQGSIPGRVIPKTQKFLLDAYLLNTQHNKVRIKGKWNNPGKGVALSHYTSV